jgi:hypothetical protein
MSQAAILNSPFDLASWPITTAITGLNIRPSGISIEFSKKDGPGRWPDVAARVDGRVGYARHVPQHLGEVVTALQ